MTTASHRWTGTASSSLPSVQQEVAYFCGQVPKLTGRMGASATRFKYDSIVRREVVAGQRSRMNDAVRLFARNWACDECREDSTLDFDSVIEDCEAVAHGIVTQHGTETPIDYKGALRCPFDGSVLEYDGGRHGCSECSFAWRDDK